MVTEHREEEIIEASLSIVECTRPCNRRRRRCASVYEMHTRTSQREI